MSHKKSKKKGQSALYKWFFLIIACCDIGTWAMFFLLTPDGLWQYSFILIRSVFCLCIFFFIKSYMEIDKDNKGFFMFLSFCFFFCFSVFGIAATLYLYRFISKPQNEKAMLYHIDKEEGEEEEDEENIELNIDLEELYNVSPLIDGMTDDEKNVRVATIMAMEEVDSDSTRQMLISAKKDTSKEVQYYAHEALKKISDMYFSRIMDILKVVKKQESPDYKHLKELADLYSQFAEANIEHPVITESYRAEAINIYKRLLKLNPEERPDILYQLIPALYYNREYDACLKYCYEIEDGDKNYDFIWSFKARAFFALRDIPALMHMRNEMRNLVSDSLEGALDVLAV